MYLLIKGELYVLVPYNEKLERRSELIREAYDKIKFL